MEVTDLLNKTVTGKEVIEIFENFFGKDLVDNDYPVNDSPSDFTFYITVRFPTVTITNENEESVTIKELYVKVAVSKDGFFGNHNFKMLRTNYPLMHWISGYAHSHLPGINTLFVNPCLGRGPIVNTIDALRDKNDYLTWEAFCDELNTYVKVESLEGVPYRRMSNIGSFVGETPNDSESQVCFARSHNIYNNTFKSILREFLTFYILNHNINISYVQDSYKLAGSIKDFWLKISKEFIDWYNRKRLLYPEEFKFPVENLISSKILGYYTIVNGHIVAGNQQTRIADMINRANELNGKELLTFKGNPVRLEITDFEIQENNGIVLLSSGIVGWLIWNISKIFNTKYGKEGTESETGKSYYF